MSRIYLSILIISCLIALGTAGASDWPLFKKDTTNSGITPNRVPDHPIILWSADIERMETTPLISSGLVYAFGGNGSAYSFKNETGQLAWRSQLQGWVFQMSALASGGGKIFAATDSGLLAAFDALTGQQLWKQEVTDKRFESPLIFIDGRLYLGEGSAYGTGQKRFFCFGEGGLERWNVSRITKGYQWCGACEAGRYLVFGGNDGVLLSLNKSSGEVVDELYLNDSNRLRFSRDRPGRVRASAASGEGCIYITSEISAQEGYAWKIGLQNNTGKFEDHGWSSSVGFSTSTPSVYKGRVYLGTGEHGHPGALVCLNDSSGEVIWSYPVEAGVKSSPALSTAWKRPRILFTASQVNESVYCLEDSGEKAELLWKLNPPDDGYLLGGVAVSDGRVYFGTEGDQHSGKLYCLADDDRSAAGQDWPQFHSGAEHAGSADFRPPVSNQTIWISRDIGAQPGSSVCVAQGKLFINCVDMLTCLDRETGELLWTFPFNASGDYAFGFTPVFSRGRVFFTSDRTYCLNASDGTVVWSFSQPTGRFAIDGSPAIADGRVLVSDWDGHHYYCLDEETGEELWNFTVEGNAQSTPAISGGRVVLSGWEWGLGGRVYCLYLDNGTEIWNLSTRNSPCGSAALSDDAAYLTAYSFEGDGDVMALSLQNGSLLWQESIARTDCTPVLAAGRIYVCGGTDGYSEKATYCLDAKTGEVIWETKADEGIGDWRCSPAYAHGLLFVGQTENMNYTALLALNAGTGEPVWSYPGGGSSPAVAGGVAYTIGQGRVYAIGQGGDAQ